MRSSSLSRWILLLVVTFASRAAAAAEPGLQGHWTFDEGQGDIAADASGHVGDGEVIGARWVKGAFGTALRFDGQGAHVSVPEVPGLDGSEQLTVSAWVVWEGEGRYPNIVTGGTWSPGGFLMFVRDDQCSFRLGSPSRDPWQETSAPLVTSFERERWYHLTATFQRPVLKTYVNGQQVGSASWDHPISYHGDLLIGKWAGTATHHGLIDDVKIYSRALSDEQVRFGFEQSRAVHSARASRDTYTLIPAADPVARAAIVLENATAKLALDARGRCVALIDKSTGDNRLLRSTPMVSLRAGSLTDSRATCSQDGQRLKFHFPRSQTDVVLRTRTEPRYFTFQIESVSGRPVHELTFVNLMLKPCDRVSLMSGLAADSQGGVCIRALNARTKVVVGGQPLSVTAAAFTEYGLLAGHAAVAVSAMPEMLSTLQQLVRAENQPYSPLGGPFALQAEENRGSYVFARVSEQNVRQWIELARRGGIQTVHMSGWEHSLGHYEPNRQLFPRGLEGIKAVVDQLHAAGLKVGIHTLTGCISPHDPWVTPVPHPNLATDGTYTLTADLSASDTVVPTLEVPEDHPTIWAYGSRGNCIRVDEELIQYASLARDGQPGFLQCRRGAFGTRVAPHEKGAKVEHLYVRYGCFVPDEQSPLVDEVADAIAHVYNTCQLDQVYMDGAEAMKNWYGVARIRQAIYTRLTRPALVEASEWGHHSWTFHSRMGAWDHPKWGLKRFADDHLSAVERYRESDLLEAQLGWWVILGPDRDWDLELPDEMEYLSAKALAHDVPLSLQSVSPRHPANARQDELLTIVGQYERLRLAGYFTETVKEQLREPRAEFQLVRDEAGQWQFLPTDYLTHKVTALDNGSNHWTVHNRFDSQDLRLRLQILYAAEAYDDPPNVSLTEFTDPAAFSAVEGAQNVRGSLTAATEPARQGATSGCLSMTSDNNTREGAWARAVRTFDPVRDLTQFDALGVWVHGDGKGELLNLQLSNLPEYFRTLDDHYIKVDFHGWRYFELLMRERDAAAYHDYQWPYRAHTVLHRSPLVRQAVNKLSLYVNNLPPQETATCYLSPIKALRTRRVVLHQPSIQIGSRKLTFPVDVASGMVIEFVSLDNCRLYDERGELLQWLRPVGEVPQLQAGENQVQFQCTGTEGFRSRANVTVITSGTPVAGKNPDQLIRWPLLAHEYDPPRTICAMDGQQNQWSTVGRPNARPADVELEVEVLQVGGLTSAYDAETAHTCEDFEAGPQEEGAGYVYDAEPTESGCLAGVTQQLSRSGDLVKCGRASACYVAQSTRDDNSGWSVKYQQFAEPIDLSGYQAIGFWLHGDGGGEAFKLQLRDAAGGWQDMVTRVEFTGWRYCQFPLGGPRLKSLASINGLHLYYNSIPAGSRVSCHIDDIRVLRRPPPLPGLELSVAGSTLRVPADLYAGDRIVLLASDDCHIERADGTNDKIAVPGPWPTLPTGRSPITASLLPPHPPSFRLVVKLTKVYP